MADRKRFLKNPILRSKMETEWKNPVGDLLEEIQEQEMSSHVGGGIADDIARTIIINIVVTQANGCGRILTLSAECSRNGKSCG